MIKKKKGAREGYGKSRLGASRKRESVVVYTPDQLQKIKESVRIRKTNKPGKFIKWVRKLEGEFSREIMVVRFPQHLKRKITDEILQKLRSLNSNDADISKEREAVETWRNEKLKEAKPALTNKTSNSTIPREEAEKPRPNFKDGYPESYRNAHPSSPVRVPWVSGVVSA